MAEAVVTQRVLIRCLHELRSDKLTDEENKKLYGKCFKTHGHDYWLEVAVKGEIDSKSGLICNRDQLTEVLNREIVEKFDGHHLNKFFKSTSGEDLAREFYNILKNHLKPINLYYVRLQETAKNFFVFSETDLPLHHF